MATVSLLRGGHRERNRALAVQAPATQRVAVALDELAITIYD
jgi:hypothetical protein